MLAGAYNGVLRLLFGEVGLAPMLHWLLLDNPPLLAVAVSPTSRSIMRFHKIPAHSTLSSRNYL